METWTMDYLRNKALFICLRSASLKHGLGEFKTVIQTLDYKYVSGLYNFREFSQPSEC